METQLGGLLTALGLTAFIVVVLAATAVWAINRWLGREELATADALNAVMAATAQRRDRRESLARVLEETAKHLGAVSGSLHLLADTNRLEFVHALNVRRLDLLAAVGPQDELLTRSANGAGDLMIESVDLASPWAALSDGQPFTLAVMPLGNGRARGWLTLCWSRAGSAEACRSVLVRLGVYINQMLADFDNLEQRARDAQASNDALLRQEMLVRTVAHDMGNRMGLPKGVLHMLTGETLPPDYADLLPSACRQMDLLEHMLHEMIDPNRELNLESVPVEDVVGVSAAMMTLDQSGYTFSVNVPPGLPNILGERLSILRILDNLLRNADRHNRNGNDGALRIWLAARLVGDMIEFEVGDNGQGIPLGAQDKLFEFGFRVDTSGKVKGHGLGLWSCKRLVIAHGGDLRVESIPGQGTRFFFTLPVATEARLANWQEQFLPCQPAYA